MADIGDFKARKGLIFMAEKTGKADAEHPIDDTENRQGKDLIREEAMTSLLIIKSAVKKKYNRRIRYARYQSKR